MDDEPLAVTSNMVSKGEKPLKKGQASNLKDEEPHHHTRLRTGVTAPQNYRRLGGDSNNEDSDNLVIVQPCSNASF